MIRGDKQQGIENGHSASQKAAARVRSGLTDLKGKMALMKEKKDKAEKEMLK